MTGHSLGCYLAQIAAVEAYQKYPDFYNHVLRKVTTFSAPIKHRSRGYFESPMNDIPNFNIGKQATLDKHGYRDPKLDKVRFFKKQALPRSSS